MSKLFTGTTFVSPTSGISYRIAETVGRGSFGVVYKAHVTQSGKLVAMKVIDMFLSRQPVHAVVGETEVMKIAHVNSRGRCPELLEAFWVSVESGGGVSRPHVVLVMEYISGMSASDLLYRQGSPFCESIAIYIALEICQALNGLHAAHLVHRDIKASNIMLSTTGDVYLCDFGVSKVISDACASTLSGTPFWMAPEVLSGRPYGVAADIFSLGVTAVELITGHPPLPSISNKENRGMNIIEQAKQVTLESMLGSLDPMCVSRTYRGLVADCLVFDPNARKTAQQLLDDHSCKGGYNPKKLLGRLVSTYMYSVCFCVNCVALEFDMFPQSEPVSNECVITDDENRVELIISIVNDLLRIPADSVEQEMEERVMGLTATERNERNLLDSIRAELEREVNRNSEIQAEVSEKEKFLAEKREAIERAQAEKDSTECEVREIEKCNKTKQLDIFSVRQRIVDMDGIIRKEELKVHYELENELQELIVKKQQLMGATASATASVETTRITARELDENVKGCRGEIDAIKGEIRTISETEIMGEIRAKNETDKQIVFARGQVEGMTEELRNVTIACNRGAKKLSEKRLHAARLQEKTEQAKAELQAEKTVLESLKSDLSALVRSKETAQREIHENAKNISEVDALLKNELTIHMKHLRDTVRTIQYIESVQQTGATNLTRQLADDHQAKDEENLIEGIRMELRSFTEANSRLEQGELAALTKDCEMLKSGIDARNSERETLQAEIARVNRVVLEAKRSKYPAALSGSVKAQSRLVKTQHANAQRHKNVQDLERDCERLGEIIAREKELIDSRSEVAASNNATLVRRHFDTHLIKKEVEMKTALSENMGAEVREISKIREECAKTADSLNKAQFETEIFASIISSECEHVQTTLDIFRAKLQDIQAEVIKKSSELHLRKHLVSMREFRLRELNARIAQTKKHNKELSQSVTDKDMQVLQARLKEHQNSIKNVDESIVEMGLETNAYEIETKSLIHPMRVVEQKEPEKFRVIETIRGIKNRHSEQCRKIFELKLQLENLQKSCTDIEMKLKPKVEGADIPVRSMKIRKSASSVVSLETVLSGIPLLRIQEQALIIELQSLQIGWPDYRRRHGPKLFAASIQ